jgi:hypothetical protein
LNFNCEITETKQGKNVPNYQMHTPNTTTTTQEGISVNLKKNLRSKSQFKKQHISTTTYPVTVIVSIKKTTIITTTTTTTKSCQKHENDEKHLYASNRKE